MNRPMIVWCVTAGILLFVLVFKAIKRHETQWHCSGSKPRRLFEIGKEREMFYIPGDVEGDDFEDLYDE